MFAVSFYFSDFAILLWVLSLTNHLWVWSIDGNLFHLIKLNSQRLCCATSISPRCELEVVLIHTQNYGTCFLALSFPWFQLPAQHASWGYISCYSGLKYGFLSVLAACTITVYFCMLGVTMRGKRWEKTVNFSIGVKLYSQVSFEFWSNSGILFYLVSFITCLR